MSYILEALRKSDQQRKRGAAPTLLAAQALALAPTQPVWYGLFGAVLLGVGVAIGWLHPWQLESSAPQLPNAASGAPSARAPAIESRAPAIESRAPAIESRAPAIEARVPAIESRVPAIESRAPPIVREHTKQPAGADANDAARVASVPPITELPLSVQQELPAMTISVHAYSGKPADRLVSINSRLQREGEFVAPGLKLEQITPQGMIFSYKGYSFRRGVK